VHDFVLRVDTMLEHNRRFPKLSDGRTPKSATDVAISGRVVDDSGFAIPSASLRLEGTGFAVVTDDSGRYTLAIPAIVAEAPTTFVVIRMDYALTRVSAFRAGAPVTRTFVMSKRIYSDLAAALDARIVSAAGLSDLRRGPHRRGEREIRIRTDGGIAQPNMLYRLWNRAGVAGGEVIRYVSLRDEDEPVTGASAGARLHPCKNTSDDVFPCRARFSHEPDWSRLWKTLDSLDIWNIVDEGTLRRPWSIVLDGTTITAELWNGHEYKAWAYVAGVEDREPGRAKVTAVSGLLQDIDSVMAP
jgi:hypothetical protein